MTLFEEKIHELKKFSAKHFGTTIEKIESKCRRQENADARKCVTLLSREFYPEVNCNFIAKHINKRGGSTRKILAYTKNIYKFNKNFRSKVILVREEVIKSRK